MKSSFIARMRLRAHRGEWGPGANHYLEHAACPTSLGFIARISGNHPDASEPELDRAERMVSYLQRALGYSLTGTTEEEAVFVPFGFGDNCKAMLLSTFLFVLEEPLHAQQERRDSGNRRSRPLSASTSEHGATSPASRQAHQEPVCSPNFVEDDTLGEKLSTGPGG